jgi:hypothetical protein
MKLATRLILLLPALALSGCAVNSYCEGQQKYMEAKSLAPLQSADGAKVPESASALRIPPPPTNPVPFGQTVKDEDGDDAIACLDKPPEMAAAPAVPKATPPAEQPASPPPAAEPPGVPPPPKQQ